MPRPSPSTDGRWPLPATGRRPLRRPRLSARRRERSQQPRRTLLNGTARPAEAEAEYREALAIRRQLVKDHPGVLDFRNRLADSHDNLGLLLHGTGKTAGAEAEYRESLRIRAELVQDNPALTGFTSRLAGTHHNLAWLLDQTGRSSDATTEYQKAAAILEKLADETQRSSSSAVAWRSSATTSPTSCRARAGYRKRQPSTPRSRQSSRSWPMNPQPSPRSATG